MFASRFCLTVLPVEILEQIFLRLPGQDIFMAEAVCGAAVDHAISR